MSRAAATTKRHRDRGTVERTLVSIALLCTAVVAALVCVLAIGLVDPTRLLSDPELRERLMGFVTDSGWTQRAAIATLSLAVAATATFLLLRKSGSRTSGFGPHVVSADERGAVLVSTEGVAAIAETAAERATGVTEARARISGRGLSPVRIGIAANVMPGADMAATGNYIRDGARDAVERLAGLDVSEVTVRLDIAEDNSFMEVT